MFKDSYQIYYYKNEKGEAPARDYLLNYE